MCAYVFSRQRGSVEHFSRVFEWERERPASCAVPFFDPSEMKMIEAFRRRVGYSFDYATCKFYLYEKKGLVAGRQSEIGDERVLLIKRVASQDILDVNMIFPVLF